MIFLKIVNSIKRLLGAVAQLGERLDGIQKVVGSIPSSSTNYKILCLIFFSLITKNVFAETVESHKLLIPGETFRNDNHKKNEIKNYLAAGISYEKYRQKKCYKKAFVIFQNSKLCTHDPHLCAQDYAVDEIFYFQRYKKLLNKISDVCAQGYPLDWTDQKVITGNLKKDVDEFLVFLKSKKKTDYDASPEKILAAQRTKQQEKIKKRQTQTGAHGAIPAPKDDNIGSKVEKLNPVPVDPVAINNIEESKQNENKKTQVNKKELELLKKQVEELKKAEKKKQQEIEKLKKSEIKKRKELEAARKADEKKEKELRNITTKVETKDMELQKTKKADEEKRKQLEIAKKQLNYVKKELESIKTEEVDNLKKELDEMTRGDDIECVGKVEFQMECVETNAQGKRHYYELKKIGSFICSKLKITENDYSDGSYRKIYGDVIESDAKKGRFIVSEYGSTGENKEKKIYDFNQKQKFLDIDDPFSFEKCE